MDLSAALARDLALLSDAIEDGAGDGGRVDLVDSIARTVQAARAAVASCVGLAVVTGAEPSDLRFTVLQDGVTAPEVRASLRVPFRPTSPGGQEPAVIFFASTPGAFVDLAADIAWLTGQAPTDLALDENLQPPRGGAGVVAARSVIDQAIGVLLARGRTPEQGRAEIARRAAADGSDLEQAARQTIAEQLAHLVDDRSDDRMTGDGVH